LKATYFCFDDWNGLYLDDELVLQGHSWGEIDTLIAIKKTGQPITEAVFIEGNYDVLGDLDPWGGRCPDSLQAILDYPNAIQYQKSY
jgi:hypothetical protein